jgi:ribonuclease HI
LKNVTIYTDGACIRNPGPGGYGVVLLYGQHRKELFGGYRLTTNNRMELMAAIAGLRALKAPCSVTLYSDSEYLVTSMQAGLPQTWRERGWRRGKRGKALNSDLWQQVLDLSTKHKIQFEWVRGHSGNPENERCDQLSQYAARQPALPADTGYEGADTARVASG